MGKALANKYRPKKFEDVVAQTSVKIILMNQLENEQYKNAYLFCGGAGTGKTTTARIIANEINEGKGNPIEVDGASNNGVDNIREIIDSCKFQSITCKYKIFIIDECHMLSTGAWNAMLKVLEEPPANTIFILCTTDPQKIPNTILSRVQRFDFKRIPTDLIVERLQFIVDSENKEGAEIVAEQDGLEYIAKLADGGMRDSITMLDKVLDYTKEITYENVVTALGAPNYEEYFDLLDAIFNQDKVSCINAIEDAYMNGKDLKLYMRNFTNFVLDVTKFILTEDEQVVSIPSIFLGRLDYTEEEIEFLIDALDSLNKLCQTIKWEGSPKPIIEAEVIILCQD